MASKGTVKLKAIWKMLDECAAGYTKKERVHQWVVMWKDRTFPSLPKGQHGKAKKEIQLGHVRCLVNHLEIDYGCAESHLPQLK